MLPNKIQVKLFIQSAVDLKGLIPVFHRWIQEDALKGLLIDVADYRHVPNGPGLLLMGHEGDYALDLADGRPGIVYKHKRDWPTDTNTLETRLSFVLDRVQQAAQLLRSQADLIINEEEVEVRFPDRLTTPNTAESFSAVESSLLADNGRTLGKQVTDIAQTSADQRQSLAVLVQTAPVAEPV